MPNPSNSKIQLASLDSPENIVLLDDIEEFTVIRKDELPEEFTSKGGQDCYLFSYIIKIVLCYNC